MIDKEFNGVGSQLVGRYVNGTQSTNQDYHSMGVPGYVKGNPSVEILGGKSHPKAQSTIKLKIDLRKNSVFRLDIK